MLGFIIFGWPKREKFLGTSSPGFCHHCQNEAMFGLVKTRRWFTLFWIPLLPLERADHYLVCDICGAFLELDTDTADAAKEMTEKTEMAADGRMPEEEYYAAVEDFFAEVRGEATPQSLEEDAPLDDTDINEVDADQTRYIQ